MTAKMEQPFYHDDSGFLTGYAAHHHSDVALTPHDSYKLLKQSMSLNLNSTDSYHHHHQHHQRGGLKSQLRAADVSELFQGGQNHQDLGSLKLASPELERLIIQSSSSGVLTSPTPGQYFYSRGITDEQEGFAEGFVKALDELHKINQVQIPPNVSLGAVGGGVPCSVNSSVFGSTAQQQQQTDAPIYTTLNAYCPGNNTATLSSSCYPPTATISYLPPPPPPPASSQHNSHLTNTQTQTHTSSLFQHHPSSASSSSLLHLHRLKEEPQTVPDLLGSDAASSSCSPSPMSPIDMEDQERIKAERKRLRNRLAATKCRKRKLERISRLEDKVKVLKSDNAGLSGAAKTLREQVARLKQRVMTHVSSGCQLMLTSKMEAF